MVCCCSTKVPSSSQESFCRKPISFFITIQVFLGLFYFKLSNNFFFAKAISFLEVDMLHFTVTFFLKESNRELDIESGQLDTFCKLSSKSHLLFLCYHGWAWIGCKLKDVVIRQESTSSSENSKDTILLTKARHSSQP